MLNFWNDYKTHILALAGALASFAFAMEWIDLKLYLGLGGLLGFGATSTLRHGVATTKAAVLEQVQRVEAKVEQVPVATAQAVAPVVVKAASLVAQETVAASTPPLVQLTNLSPERR